MGKRRERGWWEGEEWSEQMGRMVIMDGSGQGFVVKQLLGWYCEVIPCML